jgi:hypothetical protein
LNQRFTTQARVWIKGTINIQEIELEAHNTYKRLGKRYSIQKRDWIRDWFRDIAQRWETGSGVQYRKIDYCSIVTRDWCDSDIQHPNYMVQRCGGAKNMEAYWQGLRNLTRWYRVLC